MYQVVLQSEAISDMQDAYDWYEEQRTGLGNEFVEEVEISLEKISEHPEYYSYVNDIYRRIKTNRFPYLIIYEIENNTVFVNSIMHGMRNSKY
ncbi:type II toxin-antitoxin system RelE/ParE family toxin [Arachidicoccus ginsenosidimutans]|uniref:type II toxin-antitoxin system RelE/ParE family toxin n=1 Tax=Arachidicoccus sp. BS20 TaxID=1850526 RepID=UPI0009ED3400|nr:type II toxin-antitoxin system RelE/ParE family toxin [Arachidicoccus sp. BS20]